MFKANEGDRNVKETKIIYIKMKITAVQGPQNIGVSTGLFDL